ncbi:UNVERIFIED_CONTAM: hypothetical protein FKN15_026382 [Acipenser sinensis]
MSHTGRNAASFYNNNGSGGGGCYPESLVDLGSYLEPPPSPHSTNLHPHITDDPLGYSTSKNTFHYPSGPQAHSQPSLEGYHYPGSSFEDLLPRVGVIVTEGARGGDGKGQDGGRAALVAPHQGQVGGYLPQQSQPYQLSHSHCVQTAGGLSTSTAPPSVSSQLRLVRVSAL